MGKIAPQLDFQMIAVIGILVNFIFCYVWEVYFLDCLLFQKVLPWYKEKIRGPNLEFEHLERELVNSSVWPPLGKNNKMTIVAKSKSACPELLLPATPYQMSLQA